MDVYIDKYMANKSKFDRMKQYGIEICTVDCNGAYVPMEKNDASNLTETEDNIRDRFALDEANDEDGGEY